MKRFNEKNGASPAMQLQLLTSDMMDGYKLDLNKPLWRDILSNMIYFAKDLTIAEQEKKNKKKK